MEHFSLAGDFPKRSEADWRATVAKALKDAPFETLGTTLYEGFRAKPLYTDNGEAAPLFGNRGWSIVQPLGDASALADDLANDVLAFSLAFGASSSLETKGDVEALIGGATGASFYLAHASGLAEAALLVASKDAKTLKGSAGFDPLTAFALSGERPADKSGAAFAGPVDAAFYLREHAPSFLPFLASGHAWNGAGASAVEELGFTLAAAVAYWRALANAGMPLSDASRAIGFSLSATQNIFITIAQFRAMRLLWARALAAADIAPNADLLLLARMPRRILSVYDPHVNLLRATAAAFGAAIGGASAIELRAFDETESAPTPFSRRLARNTALVLQKEAWLPAVADPAAGSAYLETLTGELAARAWALFREVEGKGGLAAAIESGFVAEKLRRPAELRERAIARRREKLTGVSEFPNLAETAPVAKPVEAKPVPHAPVTEVILPPPGKGERFGALVDAASRGVPLDELRAASRIVREKAASPLDASKRDAEAFENLRRRSDIALARIGSRPPVFLATLGKADQYRARANWLQGFFAAGGIEVLTPPEGFATVEALVSAFKESPAPAACLCAANGVYASIPGAAAALKKAGAVLVYLAGPAGLLKTLDPKDMIAIDRVIYDGCNALAVLEEAQRVLCVNELSEAAGLEAEEAGFEVYAEVEPRSY